MIKDLITDMKLATMDVISEVKDMAHDMTTKLPNEELVQFDTMTAHQQSQSNIDYMSNPWSQMPSQMTANRIDMTAEKMSFVTEMIQNGLLAFDSIEVELKTMASSSTPPTPSQLIGIATRVDANQKQIFMGLQKLRELSVEIDKATDTLQGNKQQNQQGWNNKPVGWY